MPYACAVVSYKFFKTYSGICLVFVHKNILHCTWCVCVLSFGVLILHFALLCLFAFLDSVRMWHVEGVY